jgi:glycosyltransferase involved in cell wall biosynthesis
MGKPKISVCCIGYNHEKYAEECIRSIWNQDIKDIEIIVIEDGSTDGTYKLLLELTEKSPCSMKVLTHKNTYNIGLNLNKTLKEAKGEYLFMTSLDDYYYPNVFGYLLSEIEKDPNIQFVGTKPYDKSMYCFDVSRYDYDKITAQELLDLERNTACGFWLHSTIWRKSVIDTIGGFDEDIIGDDIVLRIKTLKHIIKNPDMKFRFIDKKVFHHRVHDANISHNYERQCQILHEVLERYFSDYKNSKLLYSWVKSTILSYILKFRFKDAFRMMFFDKKNKNKTKMFLMLPFHVVSTIYKKVKNI